MVVDRQFSHEFLSRLRDRAREMRKKLTPAELRLWTHLRNDKLLGLRFRRQHVIPPFITDFYCPAVSLVVEVDGDTHADAMQADYDARRTAFFTDRGFTELRFTNNDVMTNTDGVMSEILRVVETLRPSPPPSPRRTGAREATVRPPARVFNNDSR